MNLPMTRWSMVSVLLHTNHPPPGSRHWDVLDRTGPPSYRLVIIEFANLPMTRWSMVRTRRVGKMVRTRRVGSWFSTDMDLDNYEL